MNECENLNIIQKFISENKITPKDCVYHTNRPVKNSKDKYTGAIRVLVLKKDNIARCEYICPECKFHGYKETSWKRPFSIKCEKCGYLIRVPRMRDEIKRERYDNKI
ncbi:MAG: hypothetical protein QXL09_01150 [Candidatus Aenigmatarchaeota archaeon]